MQAFKAMEAEVHAALADRSGRASHGNQRQGNRHRRLQCAGQDLLALEVAAVGQDIERLDAHDGLGLTRHVRELIAVVADIGDVVGHDQVVLRIDGGLLKTQCTTGKERRIKRWEHEAVIDAMQDRLDRAPKSMRVRRATVEHPFGTLKAWMGATHFKTRTLEKVRTEMSLHVLAYNLKRVIAIVGAQPLMEAMRA